MPTIKLNNKYILSEWNNQNYGLNYFRYLEINNVISPEDCLGYVAYSYQFGEPCVKWHLYFSNSLNFIADEYYKLYNKKIYHKDKLEEAMVYLDSFLIKIGKLLPFI